MKTPLATKGCRFLVVKDMPCLGLASYAAPASGGFKCIVPAGTILVATQNQRLGFPGFYCRPENHEELETILVPESDRQNKYTGYILVCESADIDGALKLIASDEKN